MGFSPWVERIPWRRKLQPAFSSIPTWRILWTEEPGRLQSMESQRVRYDLVTKQQQEYVRGSWNTNQVCWCISWVNKRQIGGRQTQILCWPKSSFKFFHNILWKNGNELFRQPDGQLDRQSRQLYLHSQDVSFINIYIGSFKIEDQSTLHTFPHIRSLLFLYLPYKDGPKFWGHCFSVEINHKHNLLVFLS